MTFFKKLEETGVTDLVILFEIDKGQVTMQVGPKILSKENPLKHMEPIRFVGSAEEIDSCFFLHLTTHLAEGIAIDKTIPKEVIAPVVVSKPTPKSQPKVVPKAEVEKPIKEETPIVKEQPKAVETVNKEPAKPKVVELSDSAKKQLDEFKEYINTLNTQMDWVNNHVVIKSKIYKLTAQKIEDPFIDNVRGRLQSIIDASKNLDVPVADLAPKAEEVKAVPPPPPTQSLKYVFPKPFDADEQPDQTGPGVEFAEMSEREQLIAEEYHKPQVVGFRYDEDNRGGTGHGDDSYSDADNGL